MIGAKGAIYTKGVDTAVRAYDHIKTDISGDPMRSSMNVAMMYVLADAKRVCVVDTGRLRSSITHRVEALGDTRILGIVGSNVKYAPFVELGTKPHYAPMKKLSKWAERHGKTAGEIWSIIRQFGTKPHPFLKPAFEANTQRIFNLLGDTVSRIVSARYK